MNGDLNPPKTVFTADDDPEEIEEAYRRWKGISKPEEVETKISKRQQIEKNIDDLEK